MAFGEAQAYGGFIVDNVFPLIAAHYRADMRRKIFSAIPTAACSAWRCC